MVSKAINCNKLPSPIARSPSTPLCVTHRPLSLTFVGPNAEFYIPNRREFSIHFKNKVDNNIGGQIPLSKHKGPRGVSDSTTKRRLFEIPITSM